MVPFDQEEANALTLAEKVRENQLELAKQSKFQVPKREIWGSFHLHG